MKAAESGFDQVANTPAVMALPPDQIDCHI
jgi:hypothetical protein